MSDLIKGIKHNINFENLLSSTIKSPLARINRDKFLYTELIKYYPESIVQTATTLNPARAGIPKDLINRISVQVIRFESTKLAGLSTAASVAGSINPAAAVPAAVADATLYINTTFRVAQKLAYLYGFDEFDLNNDEIDSETMNEIIVFIGVMFGANGAATALSKLADIMAKRVSKTLTQKALTKGTIYPLIKKISVKIGLRMTKQVYADGAASAIPYIGAVLSGGLTLAMFAPSCVRLRNHLACCNLCNPSFYSIQEIKPNKNIASESNEISP